MVDFGCAFQNYSRNLNCLPLFDNGRGKILGNLNFQVCDTIVDFLKKAKNNKTETSYKNLLKNKISFFLHLDETDEISHDQGQIQRK